MKRQNKEEKRIHHSLSNIMNTSVIVFIGIFLSKIFLYIYRVIIARYLGVETYGLFSLGLIVYGWTTVIAGLGISEGILKFIPGYRGKKEFDKIRYIFKKSIKILNISAVISTIIIIIFAKTIAVDLFHNAQLTNMIYIFALASYLTIVSQAYLMTIQAFEKISVYSFIFNIMQNAVKVVALIILVLFGFKRNAVAVSFLIGILSMYLGGYIYSRIKIPELYKKSKIKNKKELYDKLISYSWPIMFSAAISSLFYWADSFTLGIFKGAIIVGIYNAAVPIVLLINIIPEIFMQLFFPIINKEYYQGKIKVISELSKTVAKWILIVVIPIAIFLFIFPEIIVNVMFGSDYLAASNPIRIMAIGITFLTIASISGKLIITTGKSRLTLFNTILSLVLNLILNFALVPKYGMEGAAIATTATMLVLGCLFLIEAKILTGIIPVKKSMVNILIINFIFGIILFSLKNFINNIYRLVGAAILFSILYIMILIFTKSLEKNEITMIKSLKTSLFTTKQEEEF